MFIDNVFNRKHACMLFIGSTEKDLICWIAITILILRGSFVGELKQLRFTLIANFNHVVMPVQDCQPSTQSFIYNISKVCGWN